MADEGARQQLKTLRDGLLRLHMTLLESQRASYERDVQRITSPAQYFQLALNDPWFAWLRELSQFIVMIDESLDVKNKHNELEPERLIGQARRLVSPSEEGDIFARNYFEAMQRDPGVVLAHRDIIKVFEGLGL